MKVGCPREIKVHEYRVGLVPAGVRELVADGHEVYVETCAGAGIGIDDEAYVAAGAKILASAKAVFDPADMIVKVKEPQPNWVYSPHEDYLVAFRSAGLSVRYNKKGLEGRGLYIGRKPVKQS